MRILVSFFVCACLSETVSGAPAAEKKARDLLFVPARVPISYPGLPYPQVRGPLDFIGNWIQSSEWFPIEINVPDTFAAVGNGINSFATTVGGNFNNFAQNVGSGFQTFTQNAGNTWQNFAQGLAQRPVIGAIVRPIQSPSGVVAVNTATAGGQKFYVMIPTKNIMQKVQPQVQMQHNTAELANDLFEAFP